MTGIVIVTWNSQEVIGECLDACLQLPGVEIVVIDNASMDRSVQTARERKGVQVIANAENLGFAAACNQGFRALPDASAILLLNPDAVPLGGVECLAAKVREPGIGAAGGRLVNAAGVTQSGFNIRRFPTPAALAFEVLGINRLLPLNPVNRRWRMVGVDPASEAFVDQPAGAFLMVRRSAWEAVGGFDESFWPAWFEDVDFCLRVRESGAQISFVPSAAARHLGGHSASRLTWSSRQLFWYRSLLRYSAKHFPANGRRLVAAAVMMACVPRMLAGMFSGQRLRSVSVYSRVFSAALTAWRGSTAGLSVAGSSSREEKRAKQF